MAITFNEITDSLVPFMQAEFDSSGAVRTPLSLPYRMLIIGGGTDEGAAAVNTLNGFSNADQAAKLWGRGSQLHRMAIYACKSFPSFMFYGVGAAKDALASATGKATGSFVITGSPTKAGMLYLYVGFQRITVAVEVGATLATISAAVAAAITKDFPVTADGATTAGTVALTSKNVGPAGAKIPLNINWNPGEETPAGLTVTPTQFTGGTTNPALDDAIALLSNEWFHIIVTPYIDTTSQGDLDVEMQRKFQAQAGIDGVVFMGDNSTHANMVTLCDADASGKNSKHFCFIPTKGIPQLPCEVAASVGALVTKSLRTGNGAEALPYTTLELPGVTAAKSGDRIDDFAEKQTLLEGGCSVLAFTTGGKVAIERLVTNYQKNAVGATDPSWRNLEYRFIAMYLRWDWIFNVLKFKYSRAKLAGDDARIGSGQVVMKPILAKAEALTRFFQWEKLGLVEDYEQFAEDLLAERNGQNVDRMDWMLSPNFVNQFYNGATKIAFIM
jgi:phage tail sheath gpL-like